METHKEIYEKALAAINDLFSDISVSQQKTRDSLNMLAGEMYIMIASLEK